MPRRSNGSDSPERSGEELWEDRARLLKLIAHPARLLILESLSDKSQCVKDLNSLVPLPQPYLSQHISALRRANLVASHSNGSLRCYYVTRPTLVRSLVRLLRKEHPVRLRDRDQVVREAQRQNAAPKKPTRGKVRARK